MFYGGGWQASTSTTTEASTAGQPTAVASQISTAVVGQGSLQTAEQRTTGGRKQPLTMSMVITQLLTQWSIDLEYLTFHLVLYDPDISSSYLYQPTVYQAQIQWRTCHCGQAEPQCGQKSNLGNNN